MQHNSRCALAQRVKPSRRSAHTHRPLEKLEQRRLLAAQIVGNSTVFATIQAAVDAAAAGSTILVEPGTYSEQVTVFKTLTLRGARAGVDGRSNARENRAAESIVNGVLNSSGLRTASFVLNANNIVLDGFTIEGYSATTGANAAVHMTAGRVGIQVLNNIVQNNGTGVNLSNNSSTVPLIVRGNLFRNNNGQTQHTGRALYSDGSITGGVLQNVIIDNNAFVGNRGWDPGFQVQPAIGFEALNQTTVQTNIRITNNIFDNNGKHLLAFNTNNLTIQGNWFQESWDTTSAGIRLEGGIHDVLIRDNNIYGSGARGIRIDRKASSGDNFNFTITNNNFFRNGIDGGAENAALLTGTSDDPTIVVLDGPLTAAGNWWGSSSGPGGDWGSPLGTGDDVWTRNAGNRAHISGVGNFATSPVVERQGPFWGTPSVTGFNIQFEDHDHGGSGVAYNDTTSGNTTDALHHYENVDIQTTNDTGGGFAVGNVKAGEWLEYTINVAAPGTYTFEARVASSGTGGNFHLDLDGSAISGSIGVPNTGSSNSWQTITQAGINLPAGVHILRVAFDTHPSGGSTGNFNWFKFVPGSVQQPPAAPTNLQASASSGKISLTWSDNASDETGFVIERKTGAGGAWGQIATRAANSTSYDDLTVAAATTYFYRVRAVNGGTQSANSNEASATTPAANVTYLSDLQWVSATNGYGPVEKDMGNGGSGAGDGAPITLNGVVYTKGLGAHAVSEIIYNLGGAYATFISDVGVDDRQTTNGSIVFQVFGDGVQLYQSPVMGATSATQTVNVSVAGVQQLRLLITDAGDGTSFDHGDWAGARLLAGSDPTPTLPAAPSALAASAVSASQINLAWTDNANNETGFVLERSLNGTSGWTQVATPGANATSHSDTNLTASTQYFYRIRAVNGAGPSTNSNIANATTPAAPTAPAAPSALAASAVSASQINLSWTDNSGNETGFKIERSLNGTSGWTQIGTTGANVTTFNNNTGLSAGTTYFYRVRATNGVGDSPYSNTASATTTASSSGTFIASGAVWKYLDNGSDQGTAWRAIGFNDSTWKSGAAQLGYGDGDEATVVSFGSSSSNKFITTYFRRSFDVADASAVSALNMRVLRDDGVVVYLNGVEVYRNNMPTGTITFTTGASSAVESNTYLTSALSTAALVSGTNVIAVEIHQDSGSSSDISFDMELTATLSQPATPPAAPSALAASAVSASQINLTWTDNASNESSYRIERSTDGVNFTEIGSTSANVTSFNDTTGLSAGTTYHYRVRARNSAGDSTYSNVDSATTSAPTVPAAPSNLVATAVSMSQINLTWSDNAGNETGFVIERSLDGTSGWAQIATPAVNATSFNNTGLTATTQYFYRIRAVNDVGPSADSNIANATTLADTSIPAPWATATVGSTAAGNASFANGVFTVQGAGNIGTKSDRFQFVYQTLSGNGQILARVTSAGNTSSSADAGVMIRESLAANSKHASLLITPGKGIGFVRRTSTNGNTSATGVTGAPPYWLKVIRNGSTLSAYRSTNGTTWTQVGNNVTISMASTVFVGIVVDSQSNTTLNTATFESVTVSTSTSPSFATPVTETSAQTFSAKTIVTDTENDELLLAELA